MDTSTSHEPEQHRHVLSQLRTMGKRKQVPVNRAGVAIQGGFSCLLARLLSVSEPPPNVVIFSVRMHKLEVYVYSVRMHELEVNVYSVRMHELEVYVYSVRMHELDVYV